MSKAVSNRDNVPWIVFFGHRPIYAPNQQVDGVPTGRAADVQTFFEPIMKQYEVDLYIAGHVHAYARTFPVYNNTVTSTSFSDPPSTVHIVAGGAGNREGIETFPDSKPSWYANGNDETYGYGTIVVNGENQLTWNYYLSDSAEPTVYDQFIITRN